jgi:hypothetical protein
MAPRTPGARQPCLATPLTRKLSRSVSLSAAEVAVLRDVHRRETIAEGGKYDRLLVLFEGASPFATGSYMTDAAKF